MRRKRVLVAEDKENMRKLLRRVLADRFDVVTAEDGRRALALLQTDDFDVVLTDIRMPAIDGMSVLREAKRLRPEVEVVLMTAYGSIPRAVAAIKEGAYDYLSKPFEPEEALLVVERAAERKHLREQARQLRAALDGARGMDDLVGRSDAMRAVFALIKHAAKTDASVLITGENGTGKELVARALHAASAFGKGPFVAVNCGALPEHLIESELFGHTKGAFTGAVSDKAGLFEHAQRGTLFLDEIGDLPRHLQVKLTRALQERTTRRVGGVAEHRTDARVIAATNVDLKRALDEGTFRQDLYYRLNVFSIEVPPLRERAEDIPALCAVFLERHQHHVEGFTPDALAALLDYHWPGNVRQLENAIERALAVCAGSRITVEDLSSEVVDGARSSVESAGLTDLSYRDFTELARGRASRKYLTELMREFGGDVGRAAPRAGTERESLYRLLKRHGIHAKDFKKS